jgi:hypothetical protein
VVFALLSGSASQVWALFAWPSAWGLLSWRETQWCISHGNLLLEDPLLGSFNDHHNKEMPSKFSS